MLTPLNLTTELEAVNTMLSVIGESPVQTLENPGVVDAVLARNILQATSREVQSRGWHWNTELGWRLVPDLNTGHISLPAGTLRVDSVQTSASLDLVQRGLRLWDRREHTFAIGEPVIVDILLALPFEEIPEAARRYITIRAGRVFQERYLGSDTLSAFTERDEVQALTILQEAETDTGDYNMLGSWAVARILER